MGAGDFIHCTNCSIQLPLRKPQPGETESRHVCANCGAVAFGKYDDRSRQGIQQNVQCRPVEIVAGSLAGVKGAVVDEEKGVCLVKLAVGGFVKLAADQIQLV